MRNTLIVIAIILAGSLNSVAGEQTKKLCRAKYTKLNAHQGSKHIQAPAPPAIPRTTSPHAQAAPAISAGTGSAHPHHASEATENQSQNQTLEHAIVIELDHKQ